MCSIFTFVQYIIYRLKTFEKKTSKFRSDEMIVYVYENVLKIVEKEGNSGYYYC